MDEATKVSTVKHTPAKPLPQLDLGPYYYSDSHIKGARYQIITPSGEPFMARIVAEVSDLDTARAIIARVNAYQRLVVALRQLNHMGGDERGGYCICARNYGNAPDRQHASGCADARAILRDLGEL